MADRVMAGSVCVVAMETSDLGPSPFTNCQTTGSLSTLKQIWFVQVKHQRE